MHRRWRWPSPRLQLQSLAVVLNKLMVKARTTTNIKYYEPLHAQIVKLQNQMKQLSLNLEFEKANAQDADDRYYRAKNKL